MVGIFLSAALPVLAAPPVPLEAAAVADSAAAPAPAASAAAAMPPPGHAVPARASLLPAVQADAVLQFLQKRGVLPAAGAPAGGTAPPGLVTQLREAASEAVLAAMNFLGVPYRRGGASGDEGFDCSGFTRHIFEHSLGLLLPRRADEQARARGFAEVAREHLRPGDLVFFNTLQRAFSHVGIYIGDGRFIHAPRSGAVVRIEDMGQAYWAQRFDGARRAETLAAVAQPAAVVGTRGAAAVAGPAGLPARPQAVAGGESAP